MCGSCLCCHCLYRNSYCYFQPRFSSGGGNCSSRVLKCLHFFVCVFLGGSFFSWFLTWHFRFRGLLLKTHPLQCILQHLELVGVRMIYCAVLDKRLKKAVAEAWFIPVLFCRDSSFARAGEISVVVFQLFKLYLMRNMLMAKSKTSSFMVLQKTTCRGEENFDVFAVFPRICTEEIVRITRVFQVLNPSLPRALFCCSPEVTNVYLRLLEIEN